MILEILGVVSKEFLILCETEFNGGTGLKGSPG